MASKDSTLKWRFPLVKSTLVLFIIFMPALCGTIQVNCSQPNQPALLDALTPVFNMSAIRPVKNSSTPTNVITFFTLYGILGVDEKAQLLTTYIWLDYWWRNQFVSWDPIQCGSSNISLPRDKFWVPDIVINEFMDENTAPPVPYVYLYSDGVVHDAQPVRVVSSCNLNIYTFPFDIQNCTLTFYSYIHFAFDITINLGRSAADITRVSKSVMTTMGEWELLDITSHKIMEDDDKFDSLTFHIRVRRRAMLYVVNLLIPSCFLITVDLFSFLLPPQTVDRSSFKMTLILGYTVFLLIMNDLLPITGNTIPLMNVFFSLCLALMVASLLETILITNLLFGSADFSPVPNWVRVVFLQILGFVVCLPRKKEEPGDLELETSTATKCTAVEQLTDTRGPPVEDKALLELRNLSKDLKAIRLQVEQQKGSRSSEEWIQCCPLKVKPCKVLFIFICISLLISASCSSSMLRCSRPDPPSMLEALDPVFNLSSIRPVMNLSTPTNVSIYFTLFGILGVDEKAQVLTTYIWQTLQWTNEFFSWDPEECGVSWITVPRSKLWVPDVVINEFMEKNTAPFVPYTYLYYNGHVMDSQPVKVISSCRLDIYAFPFDIQNCTLTFNSYIHKNTDVQVYLSGPVEEISEQSKKVMTTMGEWELIRITAKKFELPSAGGGNYEELCFCVVVRRRATLYVVNLLIPSCFLITVDLFSFMLPPQNVDRSLFKMTLILGYTVFLLNVNSLLPVTGDTIPLINVFLGLCLALMVASLLETIIITNLMCGSAHYSPVPRWIRVFVLHILGRLVGLSPKPRAQEDTVIPNPAAQELLSHLPFLSSAAEDSKTPDHKGEPKEDKALQELRSMGTDLQAIRCQVEHQLSRGQGTEEWIQVGAVIDRLLFILYILFISVSFITIIILWSNSFNTS
ncbi:5-hydroxytryptamine receptor 3A-like [Parambassis ranga]|uniref:5-hydroxytryptamine receptor 3A-like n=1 Tax=Parambassis ranga TaxID=210632 RepID=A0A6P7I191_9TELE|nr:5-hydroxytryptamine receptor 3A-like [Parambassis ranga]